ncbi:ATP-dependent helicase [Marine Group I thaumarchaeote]|uniref:DNA 3'-5' helicase n=1 Tax=Marine Group I thaumarchaeote TaxID=2511932 RepID=A0A7K4MNP4_9ARCH|nr:ATP-dependent helicase [Marine Group I thaumarchaeote]
MGSPLLVEAGPGSGKTEVITERVKFLTKHGGFNPSEILCITFTVKAAEVMRNRLEDDGIDTSQMTILNYHAFYHELLEKNKSYTGLGNAKIVSRVTLLVWALENIDNFNFNDEIDISQNSISEEIEAIIDGISTFRDSLLSSDELQDYIDKKKSGALSYRDAYEVIYVKKLENLAEVYRKCDEFKKRQDVMDFDDIIGLTYLLLTDPTTKHVVKELQRIYKYVLIDEFQDNNFAQFEIAKQLVTDGNITAVGDSDQSIYRFQGAYPQIFDDFRKSFPDCNEILLDVNFRNPPSVVELSTELLQQDPSRTPKELKSHKTSSEKVHIIGCNMRHDQTDYVKQNIQNLLNDKKLKVSPRDIAVLSRMQAHGKEIAEGLTALGIPVNYVGKSNIYSSPSARTLFAYLRIVTEPSHSGIQITKILRDHGITEINISKINREANNRAYEKTDGDYVLDVLSDLSSSDPHMSEITQQDQITELYKKIKSMIEFSNGNNLTRILFHIGRVETDIFANVFTDSFENYVERSVLLDIEANASELEYIKSNATVKDFLSYIEKLENFDVETDQGVGYNNSVQVSTIHQSKGKQFDYVFVIDVSPRRLPMDYTEKSYYVPPEISKGLIPAEDPKAYFINEERRLLYVAMTRTKTKLHVTYPTHQKGGHNSMPSKFLTPLNIEKNPNIDFEIFTSAFTATTGTATATSPVDVLKKEKRELAIKNIREGNYKSVLDNLIDLEKISVYEETQSTDGFEAEKFLEVKSDDVVDKQLAGGTIPTINVTNLRYSYNAFNTYEGCPLAFKFARVWKAQSSSVDPFAKNNHVYIGTVFHTVVQRAADPNDLDGKHDHAKLVEVLEDEWDTKQFLYSPKKEEGRAIETVKELLEVYQEWSEKNPNKVIGVEVEFNITIGGKLVKGYIDRLEVTPEGKYHVVDYKTGDPSTVDAENDTQLNLYAEACKRNCLKGITLKGNTLPEQAMLFFPKKDKGHREYPYKVDTGKVDEVILHLEETIKKVNAHEFPPKPGIACNYCDFKTVCEFAAPVNIKKRR